MTLKMLILGKLIDSIPLEPARIKEEGYVDSLHTLLQLKHKNLLEKNNQQFTFFIEVLSNV
jgi:hypothetical protein